MGEWRCTVYLRHSCTALRPVMIVHTCMIRHFEGRQQLSRCWPFDRRGATEAPTTCRPRPSSMSPSTPPPIGIKKSKKRTQTLNLFSALASCIKQSYFCSGYLVGPTKSGPHRTELSTAHKYIRWTYTRTHTYVGRWHQKQQFLGISAERARS